MVLTIMVERDAEEEQAYMTLLSAQSNTHGWFDTSSSSTNNNNNSPVFARPSSSYSSTGSRSGFFYTPRPPSYHQQQRVPRYGSTLSTTSHK